MVPKAEFKKKIDLANEQIRAAEGELDHALQALKVIPRAEKTQLSKVMEDAFARLRVARLTLTELAQLVPNDEGEAG